ncbi:MAG TPA: hypothetical protein PKO12_08010 [Holophaga sp.]|mgnify:FL=1|nr:hypothetical protein [Holophaga sp.]
MLLFYVFFYLVAFVLMAQGSQALGEVREPIGVVPGEVAQKPGPAQAWGGALVGLGVLDTLVGLLSHAYGWHGTFPLRCLFWTSLAAIGAYGLYILFFNRKVAYLGQPSVPSHP